MAITITDCRQIVGTYYCIPKEVMLSKTRRRKIARSRQMAMTLAREFTGASLPKIAQQFGGYDHTTVLHAVARIHDLETFAPNIHDDMQKFRNVLGALKMERALTLMDNAA
jgi:chromosomal replication initiator protein